jgi:cytochrome P450
VAGIARLASLVEWALEKARREGEMDVVADFAEPIAINSIAELFALPEADRPRFMRWSRDLAKPAAVAVNTDDVRNSVRCPGRISSASSSRRRRAIPSSRARRSSSPSR